MAKPDLKKQFEKLELELLTHKYHYYILNSPIITDYEYDLKERRFFEIGAELGIDMDTYPHWVDFDYNHPKAPKVISKIELES
jgi:NAD-dependent DNA ligase